MKKLLAVVSVVVLVLIGVGVVRPQTARLVQESWEPVIASRAEFELKGDVAIEIETLGEYVVFIEGPADEPFWSTVEHEWVQVLDRNTGHPVPASRQGVDYTYEHEGRRAQAVSRISVSLAGLYEASFSSADPYDLHARGFALTLCPADLVVEQSRQATTWWIAGIAGCALLALVGLVMLTSGGA